MTLKQLKGKKKAQAGSPDLSRIYGWHTDSEEEAETIDAMPKSTSRNVVTPVCSATCMQRLRACSHKQQSNHDVTSWMLGFTA